MKKTIIILAAIAMAALSCSKQENGGENTPPDNGQKIEKIYLKINSASVEQTGEEPTKAAIKETKFPTEQEVSVGLFVVGEGYADAKYGNIKCTKPAGSDKFTDPKIELIEGKTATVYAYYPYKDGISNVEQIPVASSVGGDDWMWATPVTEVSTEKPAIDLKLNHALALVEIKFDIYGFDHTLNNLKMTDIKLYGDGFKFGGSLNAKDGTLTPDSGEAPSESSPLASPAELQLSVSDHSVIADGLLVPVDDSRDKRSVTISCNFGGKVRKATIPESNGVIISPNTKSTILLNIKDGDSKMEVVSVGVDGWNDKVSGNSAELDGHTVTFNCPEGLKYELYTESVSTALPDEETAAGTARTVILRYDKTSIPEKRFFFLSEPSGCTFTFDEQSGIITVTDITDNVTVNLGFGTYIHYTAAAKVEPNNKSAFGFEYDEARSTFSTDSKSGVIAIDGIVTSIGKNAFKSDIKLTSVTIPEGVALIGESAFTSCKNLTSVSFSSGLTTIGNSAFDACDRLTEINFEKCTNLTAIGSTAFYDAGSDAGCSPFSLVLPEGLVEIGASAFNGSKISSVTLPSTLEKIGDTGFYRCGSLKTITSKAGNPPTLGTYVFYDLDASYNFVPLKSIEDIYVPATGIDTYKAADGWSEFSDKIKEIQE